MKLFKFFNKFIIHIILLLSVINVLLALYINKAFLILAYFLVFISMLIDATPRKPFVISTRKKGEIEWKDKLFWTYNINYLNACFWISRRINFNTKYSFTPFKELPEKDRKHLLEDYYRNK